MSSTVSNSTAPTLRGVSLASHTAFMALSVVLLLALFGAARAALLWLSAEQPELANTGLVQAFINGARFDLQIIALIMAPLVLATLSEAAMRARGLWLIWLSVSSSACLLISALELMLFEAFGLRFDPQLFILLNDGVPETLSLFGQQFGWAEVGLYWLLGTAMLLLAFYLLEWLTRSRRPYQPVSWLARVLLLCVFVLLDASALRGTWRVSGPLNWGDAYNTGDAFTDGLGLNSTLLLIDATQQQLADLGAPRWQAQLTNEQAHEIVRGMLLGAGDTLVDADKAALRRRYQPAEQAASTELRNVVVIVLSGWSARYTGALGDPSLITPYFDALAREGVLFERFFANGRGVEQALLASLSCFASLPGFEQLMSRSEARQRFSGLAPWLSEQGYSDLYLHNGSLTQGNVRGFFANQGMSHFRSAEGSLAQLYLDAGEQFTDQMMFTQAEEELRRLSEQDEAFYAVLQTSANGAPKHLPVASVSGYGEADQALSRMRYSDWALGQFFAQVRQEPYFKQTIFAILGDQALPDSRADQAFDLAQHHVPLLLIAPGLQQQFARRQQVVASQVDLLPTIMGRLGEAAQHQCWGRDVLALANTDKGFALLNAGTEEPTLALLNGSQLLLRKGQDNPELYQYRLGAKPTLEALSDDLIKRSLQRHLAAYVQSAIEAIRQQSAGNE